MRFYEIYEAIVLPNELPDKPLKNTDTIRVYHGTSGAEELITILKYGLTGDSKIFRRYSYENNNNPRGLFVTPNLQIAKEFGSYVIEFHTKIKDLEAPVWPGGTFTVQGQMAQFFNDDKDRDKAKKDQLEKLLSDDDIDDVIKNSDSPDIAYWLSAVGETQALYKGNLNPNSIKAVWISKNPSRIGQDYVRMKPKEVLKLFNSSGIPTQYGKSYKSDDLKNSSDYYKDRENKLLQPRDVGSLDALLTALEKDDYKRKIGRDSLIKILSDHPEYVRELVWSDTQYNRIIDDLKKYQKET